MAGAAVADAIASSMIASSMIASSMIARSIESKSKSKSKPKWTRVLELGAGGGGGDDPVLLPHRRELLSGGSELSVSITQRGGVRFVDLIERQFVRLCLLIEQRLACRL